MAISTPYRLDESGQKRVTVIAGDGIGPEVMAATLRVIAATGVRLALEHCEAGERVFLRGQPSGVPQETIASIHRSRVVLKGPLATPVGKGEKSANVTLRKVFETYGNIRPVRTLAAVPGPYQNRNIDLVVVRENVEDLYAGIEHMQTTNVAQCLKLISRQGCEKVARLAFAVARAEGRKRVHCVTKANIMKLTEGLFQRVFEEVSLEYPDIAASHILVDNAAHQLVRAPEQFEVLLTTNMNGDILSDLTSGLCGGLGFAAGANLGAEVAIFEAVHGTAPTIAGQDRANPCAVLLSAVMMLRHLEEHAAAAQIEQAIYLALEEGVYTEDVRRDGCVGTQAFADAVIRRLGQAPQHTSIRRTAPLVLPRIAKDKPVPRPSQRQTIGVDIFVEAQTTPAELGPLLEWLCKTSPLKLKMISNRGAKVYPDRGSLTECVDHWRCRFILREPSDTLDDATILALLQHVSLKLRWMHVEKLELWDGQPAFTRAQGED
ncbi:MAG: NADP-dependent isocitrate dehydrogenase [Myxococcales bacterium]|nr:NADP-dependent isocitrate dehydrogenase [Myxococcales bacterium]